MVRLRYKSTSRHPQSLLEIASPPWPRPREPASPLPSNQHPPPSPPSTDWIKHRSAAQPPPPEPTASLSTTLSNRCSPDICFISHPRSPVPLNTYLFSTRARKSSSPSTMVRRSCHRILTMLDSCHPARSDIRIDLFSQTHRASSANDGKVRTASQGDGT